MTILGVVFRTPHLPSKGQKGIIFYKVATIHNCETFDYKPELAKKMARKGIPPNRFREPN